VWVYDLFFKFMIMIRDWFYFNLVLPVFNFFMWLHASIMFILNIPYMMIELFFRFVFMLQRLMITIVWSILLPII